MLNFLLIKDKSCSPRSRPGMDFWVGAEETLPLSSRSPLAVRCSPLLPRLCVREHGPKSSHLPLSHRWRHFSEPTQAGVALATPSCSH